MKNVRNVHINNLNVYNVNVYNVNAWLYWTYVARSPQTAIAGSVSFFRCLDLAIVVYCMYCWSD